MASEGITKALELLLARGAITEADIVDPVVRQTVAERVKNLEETVDTILGGEPDADA